MALKKSNLFLMVSSTYLKMLLHGNQKWGFWAIVENYVMCVKDLIFKGLEKRAAEY